MKVKSYETGVVISGSILEYVLCGSLYIVVLSIVVGFIPFLNYRNGVDSASLFVLWMIVGDLLFSGLFFLIRFLAGKLGVRILFFKE